MTSNEVPPKLQRDVIREVDWLAVAPWLLVLRASKAVLGWPWLVGALGALLLERSVGVDGLIGPITTANRQLIRFTFNSVNPSYALPLRPDDTPHLALEWWAYAARLAAWLAIGVLIASFAAGQFADNPQLKSRKTISRYWRRLKRTFGAIGLLAVSAIPSVVVLVAFSWLMSHDGLASNAGYLWGVAALIAGVPLVAVWFLAIFAAPLLIAAVIVDDADPFDAVSRTAAYALQRPLALGWCVLVAWCVGVGSAAIIEWALLGIVAVIETLGAPYQLLWKYESAASSWGYFETAVRGFYPAYIFTAGVATYLVMRRQVDGQPMDEIAHAEGGVA